MKGPLRVLDKVTRFFNKESETGHRREDNARSTATALTHSAPRLSRCGKIQRPLPTSSQYTVDPPPSGRLPNELYRPILSVLPAGTKLYPLLFVNSAFYSEVQILLHTNLSLAKYGARWDQCEYVENRINLFKKLASTPKLALLVRSFDVPSFSAYNLLRKNTVGLTQRYWESLNLALSAMPNIDDLTLGNLELPGPDVPHQKINAILSGCKFRLRKLRVLDFGPQYSTISENGGVYDEVQELQISVRIEPFFMGLSLPRLAIVEMIPAGTKSWVSPYDSEGRIPALMSPPRAIKALSCPWNAELVSTQRFQAHRTLRSLSIRVETNDFAGLDSAFPSLRFLRIIFRYRLSAEGIRSGPAHLRTLVHLRKLVFEQHVESEGRFQGLHWLYFDCMPRLECVRIAGEVQNRGRAIYITWEDRSDEWKDPRWWA